MARDVGREGKGKGGANQIAVGENDATPEEGVCGAVGQALDARHKILRNPRNPKVHDELIIVDLPVRAAADCPRRHLLLSLVLLDRLSHSGRALLKEKFSSAQAPIRAAVAHNFCGRSPAPPHDRFRHHLFGSC